MLAITVVFLLEPTRVAHRERENGGEVPQKTHHTKNWVKKGYEPTTMKQATSRWVDRRTSCSRKEKGTRKKSSTEERIKFQIPSISKRRERKEVRQRKIAKLKERAVGEKGSGL